MNTSGAAAQVPNATGVEDQGGGWGMFDLEVGIEIRAYRNLFVTPRARLITAFVTTTKTWEGMSGYEEKTYDMSGFYGAGVGAKYCVPFRQLRRARLECYGIVSAAKDIGYTTLTRMRVTTDGISTGIGVGCQKRAGRKSYGVEFGVVRIPLANDHSAGGLYVMLANNL